MPRPALKTVLVVDDDPGVLRLVARLLRGDYAVRSAASGPQALRALREEAPDLLLLDIHLPGMDGLAVLREVAAARPGLAVIMLTGNTDIGTASLALSSGARGYLTKPFSREDLRGVVGLSLHPARGAAPEDGGGRPWRLARPSRGFPL